MAIKIFSYPATYSEIWEQKFGDNYLWCFAEQRVPLRTRQLKALTTMEHLKELPTINLLDMLHHKLIQVHTKSYANEFKY